MWSGMFDALESLFKWMAILLVIFVPLGAWKAFELFSWAWEHIHFY